MKLLIGLLVLLGTSSTFAFDSTVVSAYTSATSSVECSWDYYYCKAIGEVAQGLVNGENLAQFSNEVQLLVDGGLLNSELSDNEKIVSILEIHMEMIKDALAE